MSRSGPGLPLADDERCAGLIGRSIGGIELLAQLHPDIDFATILQDLCTAREWAARGFDPATGARR